MYLEIEIRFTHRCQHKSSDVNYDKRFNTMIDYKQYITLEPGKRSGKPCIRGLRITVYDVLKMLARNMSIAEITDDFPELTEEDILACLAFRAS